ncbi:MAG: ion transporter [Mariprofundus sp.]
MNTVFSDRPLFYHHMEWVLMHPRFGFLMMGLIALSFTHNRILAATLFVLFCIELGLRISIMLNKQRTNPYRSSLNQKIDALFLVLDFIGIASLLITIFNIPLDAENLAVARLLRAVYLLRTLRMFRYIDLQSAMYSPTYGMLISLIILLSFFAQNTMMWIIIIFFSVELAIRFLIMRNIRFENRRDMIGEWLYWSVDLVATLVMIPAFAFVPYGGALRMLRLIRLLRPWMVIIRNLRDVMREGQFMQEINLIVLLLAVLSIGGGVVGHFAMADYDYDQNGLANPEDKGMLAPIWFAFRMFTDPGNAIHYPNNTEIAIFSVVAVIIGVFIFAFFIGIGASIVSGLMAKLRNERLNITNHMVMLGWSSVSPFILSQLKTISERSFSKLKLVVLNHTEAMPEGMLEHSWVSYRWGNLEEVKSLQRVNLAHARQAIVSIPEGHSAADNLALATFSLIAIRKVNPEIYLNYATPGMAHPHLSSHHHMLQIGWDTQDFYNKPTVVHSQADIRANMFRNIIVYRDFDQVMERLMIPERTEESSLQVAEWDGKLDLVNGAMHLFLPDQSHSIEINALAARLLMRGVTLVALVDDKGKSHPLYHLDMLDMPQQIPSLIGIAINANALNAETYYTVKKLNKLRLPEALPDTRDIKPVTHTKTLNLLITGWIGSLPLLLQRLLSEFDHIKVTLIDDLDAAELADQLAYLRRRCSETTGANERIRAEIISWDFTDMNFLRPYVEGVDRILLSRPRNMKAEAYASIATVLSHLITIVQEQGGNPDIFPIMQNREQARVLQQELERFKLPLEIHVTVPDEFYGTYLAHTSFHMYASENEGSYELQRILRHSIDDMMGDVGDLDNMDLLALSVNRELPEDAEALFASLLQQGYVWIGYRLKDSFVWSDPVQEVIRKLFPREDDFSCLRQFQIIINPFGNPVSRHSWTEYRQQIVELIVSGQS